MLALMQFVFVILLIVCFRAGMMRNQEKFKRMQETARARKAKGSGTTLVPTSSSGPVNSSIALTPPPTATNSVATSPQNQVVCEKRGPED
jgi:hypothetical protein